MNRQVSLTTRLAATALLVGVAAVGCSGRGGHTATTQPVAPTPTAQPSLVDQASPSISAVPSASDTDTSVPSASAVAVNQVASPDPLDSPFNDLNQLINGINGSLQDAGSGGGE